jgi:hypothetical protein
MVIPFKRTFGALIFAATASLTVSNSRQGLARVTCRSSALLTTSNAAQAGCEAARSRLSSVVAGLTTSQ